MVEYQHLKCTICRAEWKLSLWYLNALRKKGAKVIYCPLGHELLLSSIPQPEPQPPVRPIRHHETIEEVIKRVQEMMKGPVE